jgi:acyl-CoA thioester hydrolase
VGQIFKTQFRPGWGEVDEDRVLHSPVMWRYFKETEARFYRSLGVPRGDVLRELDIWMPRVGTTCRFVEPIRYDQLLDMEMAVGDMSDKAFTYVYRVRRREADTCVAEGSLTILIVSGSEFRPIPIPQRLRDLLMPFFEHPEGEDELEAES